MFRQLVTPPPGGLGNVNDNINSLFSYHPLQISAIVETAWLNRNNATSSPFLPWPPQITGNVLNTDFSPGYTWASSGAGFVQNPLPKPYLIDPLQQPGLTSVQPTYWDHLIYAYLLENTRIFQIFGKVLEAYMFTEQLETPSPESQAFWRNLEFLIFGDAVPSMVWTTSGRTRRDELANRLTAYYWMFGLDLSHAAELAVQHPYQKPDAANRDFIPTFEAFGRELWRAIVNTRNTSGANDSDPTVIATLARRLYDMMATRRINGNFSREEFRAVSVMSYLNLAIVYDSPAVVDLRATASSPEMRLQKIAERVGMTSHPNTKPLLDLAGPFSILMEQIETGTFNDATGAQNLYIDPTTQTAQNAETVIDQYALATGRDLKAQAVSVVPRAKTTSMALPKRQSPPPQLSAPRPNGHSRPGQ